MANLHNHSSAATESDYIHIDNVAYHLDDIEVGEDGKCAWTDVANALTYIKLCREPLPTEPQTAGDTEQDLREQNLRGLLREARDYVEAACTDHSTSLLSDINDTLSLSHPERCDCAADDGNGLPQRRDCPAHPSHHLGTENG